MNRPRPIRPPQLIAWLGKVLNAVLLLACTAVTVWAGHLFVVRRALPYSAAGQYVNPRNGVVYDQQIVTVALGLALLFGALTGLLLFSAYKLYVATPRRRSR